MLYAKFQENRTSGTGKEDFKGFNHNIWARRQVTKTIFTKSMFPLPKKALH